MKKILIFLIIVLAFQVMGQTENLELPDLIYPQLLRVDQKRLFMVEKEKIHVYSLKPFQKLATFGKLGEGPREFRVHPGTPIMLSPTGNQLIASTGGTIYSFDLQGKYLNEQKMRGKFMASTKPVGSHFVGLGYGSKDGIRQMMVKLVDDKFNVIKILDSIPDEKQSGQGLSYLAIPQHMYTCYAVGGNRIYTSMGNTLAVKVFDHKGNHLNTITRDYKRLNLDSKYRNRVLKHYRTDPFLKQFFQYFSPISVPGIFPAIRDLRVADGMVYVITYKMKEGESEVLIFKTSGQYVKTIYLPIEEQDIRLFYPYDIRNNKLYQTVEKDEEYFELKITSF